ncbi:MAG TPA: NAD(P)/FAD-dependent oxidoreductase [Actinomycetota bacterium]|nr:NAD(P)/FAD-dependent oxidoreductase [Actinomycetota bacterium]
MESYDVLVIGGGPAGLAAGLWLGRYRRKTLISDAGEQRNLAALRSHGYLAFDGSSPQELLARADADVARYPTVHRRNDRVIELAAVGNGFVANIGDDEVTAKRVVLTTGVQDVVPEVAGFDELYGRSIFHCSCCDGYESRDMSVVAIGWGEHVAGFALDLLEWGAHVTLITDGQTFDGDADARLALARHDIEIIEDTVDCFAIEDGRMRGVRLVSGREVTAERAFFSIAHRPRTDLAVALGCETDDQGYLRVGPHGETTVEGVYAAGDVTPGEQLVLTAASTGAVAGIACALSLRGETTVAGVPDPGPDPEEELAQ